MKQQNRCKRPYLEHLEAGFKSTGSSEFLFGIFWQLYDFFGPQYWWPGHTPFEIAVGAILTQNTAWNNVEKAISNLRAHDCLEPSAIWNMPEQRLASLIRPAGYYNIKAQRLRNFVDMLMGRFDGSMKNMAGHEDSSTRKILLKVKGIGPETADSIMLYALEKPSFVIDAYTFRVLERHDVIDPAWDYHLLRDFFMDNLPLDVCLFNEFHALLVALGKTFCRPKHPDCSGCPIQGV